MIIFYLLLMMTLTRCTEQFYKTKTIRAGDDVNLTCSREGMGSLYWIRLVSNKVPEILARSSSLENIYSHITASKETGTFVLQISKAKLSDASIYICFKTYQQSLQFLTEIDLRVEEPDNTAVAPVPPRDSVILCSVPDSENKTCPGGNSLCCFRPQLRQCFNCTEGNTHDYDKDLDGACVVGFFKNVSSSDVGSYYCAVATCEETDSEKGSELNNEVNIQSPQNDTTIISVLSAALAVSLLVVVFLLYSVKKLQNKACDCCKASFVLQPASDNQEDHQTDEDSLVYSVANFTNRNSERREAKPSEEESIYTDVRARASGSLTE
ncbi:uncharacterized protein LOC114864459 isoform X2 [Betta splendens]|uniref:Uncharacterized protein LOC114864459 isoform X2 n=1 Tax=Betta splendens TaxID=158456 RepID=A0A6P7NT04_BETSP|nr:uncharacterized protein LOC114864459 isoform X2 [Betta splendens]